MPDTLVKMSVRGLMIDPSSNHPIVILRDEAEQIFLPIWIGVFEASAIQIELEKIDRARPMTHDLLSAVVTDLGAVLEKVVINDLQGQTFYAELYLNRGGETIRVDSRPSDAIAFAVRSGASLYVEKDVLDRAKAVTRTEGVDTEDPDEVRKMLEELGPDDLGKYTM